MIFIIFGEMSEILLNCELYASIDSSNYHMNVCSSSFRELYVNIMVASVVVQDPEDDINEVISIVGTVLRKTRNTYKFPQIEWITSLRTPQMKAIIHRCWVLKNAQFEMQW